MLESKRSLCVQEERYGTIDIWINPEGPGTSYKDQKYRVIATYNGEQVFENYVWATTMEEPEKDLDWIMGQLSRDVKNWSYKDIVLHWGVHTWKFVNEMNLEKVQKDEYCKELKDVPYYYDVEW